MTTWKEQLTILHLEDNADDAELLAMELERSDLDCHIHWVKTKEQFEKENFEKYDLVISDYNLNDYDGLSALKLFRNSQPIKPFIIFSGTVGEEMAVELLRKGANEFILKASLKRIPIFVSRAMREYQLATEKQRFQKELLNKNLILDTIFDNFENMIFLKDTQGRYIQVNRAFAEFFGLHQEEILGKREKDIMPKSTVGIAVENDDFVKVSGKKVTYEATLLDKSGIKKVFHITKTPLLEGGSVSGIVGECVDMTRQKVLMEESEKIQSILSQSEVLASLGSFEYDKNLDVISCSSNFKKLLNLDIVGDTISFRKLARMVNEDDRSLFMQGISTSIEECEEYDNEHRFIIDRSPEIFNKRFRVFLKPDYKDEKGNRFYGTILDTTVDHENHVYLMNRQEDERKELARELHDNLGQKMNAISMYISKLCDDIPGNEQLEKVRDLTHETIDDLSYLINNISMKTVEDHSLSYAIEKVISFMPEQLSFHTKFELEEAKISSFVKAQLYRVVQEALNNVVKYSRAQKVTVDIRQNGGIISLKIEDDGIGFDVNKVLGGNGLKNIMHRVRRSNGLINIDSEPNKGSKVTVKMPLN